MRNPSKSAVCEYQLTWNTKPIEKHVQSQLKIPFVPHCDAYFCFQVVLTSFTGLNALNSCHVVGRLNKHLQQTGATCKVCGIYHISCFVMLAENYIYICVRETFWWFTLCCAATICRCSVGAWWTSALSLRSLLCFRDGSMTHCAPIRVLTLADSDFTMICAISAAESESI